MQAFLGKRAQAGGYELICPLAQGGMGEVFLARKIGAAQFEKRVALKLLLPHLSHEPEFVQRFLDEARLAARMNHPNIVQIFDVGEAEGRYFLAMALVEGVSLFAFLSECRRRRQPLPLPVFRLVATGVCEGLEYAHRLRGPNGEPLNVVHRDVNPSNLLVAISGTVLLTDFGIAKAAVSTRNTLPGQLQGKLAYMAPEQFGDGPVDHRVDVFAAGVTLIETLTLHNPFQRETDAATLGAVQRLELPPLRTLRGDVTPRIATALKRAIAREPGGRYQSARELLNELIDGPVSQPAGLAAYVKEFCAERLDLLRIPGSGPMTVTRARSMLTEPRRARGRRVLAASVLAAVGLLIVGALVVRAADAARAANSVGRQPTGADPAKKAAPSQPLARPVPDEAGGEAAVAATPPARVTMPPPPKAKPKATPAKATARVAPAPVPVPPADARPPDSAVLKLGYLTANSEPWSEIALDGRPLERTPISRYPVTVGEHTVVFREPTSGKEVRRNVVIREGETEKIRIEFAE